MAYQIPDGDWMAEEVDQRLTELLDAMARQFDHEEPHWGHALVTRMFSDTFESSLWWGFDDGWAKARLLVARTGDPEADRSRQVRVAVATGSVGFIMGADSTVPVKRPDKRTPRSIVSEVPENLAGKLADFLRRRHATDAPLWQDEDGAVSFLCTI